MNKKILLFFMAFVFGMPFTSAAQRPMEKEALCLQSEILGKDVAYSIVLPAGYSANNNRYPVVYMLHGIGGDCSTWMEYGHVATVMDNMVKAEQILPFIIVIPDGYLSYYVDSYDGRQPYEEFFIHELKPFIDEHYRTMPDAAHQAVMGFPWEVPARCRWPFATMVFSVLPLLSPHPSGRTNSICWKIHSLHGMNSGEKSSVG